MTLLRTPDERFRDLPGFPYEPRYLDWKGARVHYIDEGHGEPILCLHGEPTWSYLYRKMIPPLAAAHRVIAPDFLGFGRSDKFASIDDYSFQMHVHMLHGFIAGLGLHGVTLVCQDWGGLIGLRVAAEAPDRFARLVIMNTGLPTGDEPASDAFLAWRDFAVRVDDLPIGLIMRRTLANGDQVPEPVIAAYEAPFPDASYKAGARAFPRLVPISPDDPGSEGMRRTRARLAEWTRPALVLFSDGDPITRGGDRFFRRLIPSAALQPEITIRGGSHFLQEDKGEEIAAEILSFLARSPV